MSDISLKIKPYKSMTIRKRAADIISFSVLLIMAAAVMLPIWWMFRSSLMTNAELYAYPPSFFPAGGSYPIIKPH